jgi:hypothetical protein
VDPMNGTITSTSNASLAGIEQGMSAIHGEGVVWSNGDGREEKE